MGLLSFVRTREPGAEHQRSWRFWSRQAARNPILPFRSATRPKVQEDREVDSDLTTQDNSSTQSGFPSDTSVNELRQIGAASITNDTIAQPGDRQLGNPATTINTNNDPRARPKHIRVGLGLMLDKDLPKLAPRPIPIVNSTKFFTPRHARTPSICSSSSSLSSAATGGSRLSKWKYRRLGQNMIRLPQEPAITEVQTHTAGMTAPAPLGKRSSGRASDVESHAQEGSKQGCFFEDTVSKSPSRSGRSGHFTTTVASSQSSARSALWTPISGPSASLISSSISPPLGSSEITKVPNVLPTSNTKDEVLVQKQNDPVTESHLTGLDFHKIPGALPRANAPIPWARNEPSHKQTPTPNATISPNTTGSTTCSYRTVPQPISPTSTGTSKISATPTGGSSWSFETAPIDPANRQAVPSSLGERALEGCVEEEPPNRMTLFNQKILAMDLVPTAEEEHDWSGRGQYAEFDPSEEVPLKRLARLGSGVCGDVDSVLCRRIKLARKTMMFGRKLSLDEVLKEVQHLHRLRHPHIIRLVGSYLQGRTFAILMYPVAQYNLSEFLRESTIRGDVDHEKRHRLQALAGFFTCLAHALQYIHTKDTAHTDIKPNNILVRRLAGDAYQVFIGDFGTSRHFPNALSQTESVKPRTRVYCAPEVANVDPQGRSVDVFCLGCVFLEMETVVRARTLDEFVGFRARKGDGEDVSFQGNLGAVGEWIVELGECGPVEAAASAGDHRKRLAVIASMLQRDPAARPSADGVLSRLSPGGGLEPCCGQLQCSYEIEDE